MSFVADFGMSVQDAAHHPRIDVSSPDLVTADRRLPAGVLQALRGDGPIEVVEHGVAPVHSSACLNIIVQHADRAAESHQRRVWLWSAALSQH